MPQAGMDATRKLHGEGFKRLTLPLIKMDAAVKAKVEKLVDMGGQPCKYGSPYHEDDH